MIDYLTKRLDMDFETAVNHVEAIVKEEGFSVLLVKSIDEIFKKKLGITDYPRYTTILACAPEYAKGALDVSKLTGFLFPCSFVVYEENDQVMVGHISIMKIAPAIGLASEEGMAPVIKMTGEGVHRAWERF